MHRPIRHTSPHGLTLKSEERVLFTELILIRLLTLCAYGEQTNHIELGTSTSSGKANVALSQQNFVKLLKHSTEEQNENEARLPSQPSARRVPAWGAGCRLRLDSYVRAHLRSGSPSRGEAASLFLSD